MRMQPHALAVVFYGLTLAAASAAGFEGTYKSAGGGYSQEADITRAPDGRYKVEVYVGTDGCSGAFAGVGRIEGADLVAHASDKAGPCRLVISKSRAGVTIKEGDGCSYWHGASCGFDGTLGRRAASRRPHQAPHAAPGPAEAGQQSEHGQADEGERQRQ